MVSVTWDLPRFLVLPAAVELLSLKEQQGFSNRGFLGYLPSTAEFSGSLNQPYHLSSTVKVTAHMFPLDCISLGSTLNLLLNSGLH